MITLKSSRLIRIALVIVAAWTAVSCGQATRRATTERDVLSSVLKKQELRAGYFIQPPAVMKNPNTGDLRGTFVDAINEIGKELGVRVTFVEVDLAQFAAGLQSGLYDVSIGPTFRTISRAKAVAFTNSIYYIGYDGIVRTGQANRFDTEADIDRPGVKVSVKEGSAIHQYVMRTFKHATVLVLSGTDLSLPLQAVSSGQADVGLMNEHTVEYYLRDHRNVEVVLKSKPIQVAGMSWAVRPDDQKWLNFLNTSIDTLIVSGQMAQWERKYYGEILRRHFVEDTVARAVSVK